MLRKMQRYSLKILFYRGEEINVKDLTDKEMEKPNGIVIKAQTGIYYVQQDGHVVECTLRGRLKREFQIEVGGKRKNIFSDPVAVGDSVIITVVGGDKGAIEAIMPRKSKLSRVAPGSYLKLKAKQTRVPRRLKSYGTALGPIPIEQVVVANADLLLITLSTKLPQFNAHLLDRFLIVAEAGGLEPIICINKMDLLSDEEREKLFQETRIYEDIGYKALYTCAIKHEGLNELADLMKGKITALAGPSGAGKSTILNAIQPNLRLRTAEVSDKTQKGKHTTSNVELYPLDLGGYVVDTPGIRELGLWDIWKNEMHVFFPEIRSYVTSCRFPNCSHINEPGCAVREAVKQGKITQVRYESYLKLRSGAPESGLDLSESE